MDQGERKKVAVILLYMGGPDTFGAIRPFLFNLFRDRDIIKIPGGIVPQVIFAYALSGIRSRKVRPMYETMGGGSPLNSITSNQAVSLEAALNEKGEEIFSTHVGMRYWYPFTREAVAEAAGTGPSALVALPLYPHFSRATTGSSFNELDRSLAKEKVTVPVLKIEDFHNHTGYIGSLKEKLGRSLMDLPIEKTAVIFSAHGLPRSLIEGGDPYLEQVEATVALVMQGFPDLAHYLSFQSRAGRDWLEPSTENVIELAGKSDFENIVMVPISFVSDHVETLYEMDLLYREMAEAYGLNFSRTESLNDSGLFIKALADIVTARLAG